MGRAETLCKIRLNRRISNRRSDGDLNDAVEFVLRDLRSAGIAAPDEADPCILNAIKMYVKAVDEDDEKKSAHWMQQYKELKATLMSTTGYGFPAEMKVQP